MKKKLTIGLVFGGYSVEHEISLLSAKSVFDAFDKDKYDVVLIGVDKQGHFVKQQDIGTSIKPCKANSVLLPATTAGKALLTDLGQTTTDTLDAIFPLIHGNTGEDGAIQGLLKLLDIPYVGSDILGCAITMDKTVAKQLIQSAGLPTSRFISIRKGDYSQIDYDTIIQTIGLPCFVKPANSGSSVGIDKAHDRSSLIKVIEEAFLYDTKILIEEYIEGRELECGVLGHTHPSASVIGEIKTSYSFYSYEAKYLNTSTLKLDIPANDLSQDDIQRLQTYAIKVFKLLECSGMARVDFFMDKQGAIFINEVNTIPGFTDVSMYPSLWKASGLSYSELIDTLIQLAIEKHSESNAIKRQVDYVHSHLSEQASHSKQA